MADVRAGERQGDKLLAGALRRASRSLDAWAGRLEARQSPDWHRIAVGGLWEEMGEKQFEFLRSEGLAPGHRLLDVGCGSLRGGVHFIGYLQPGRYVGVDKDPYLIEAGRRELAAAGLGDRRPTLVRTDQFEYRQFGQFDFAIAQSVFTHIPLNAIMRCIGGVEEVLRSGGRFYATFFMNPGPRLRRDPVQMGPPEAMETFETFIDADLYCYDPDVFSWMCEGSELDCEYLGGWGHPRGQHMLVFTRR